MKKNILLILTLHIISIFLMNTVRAEEYAVVTNKNIQFNGSNKEKQSVLKRIFLHQQSFWPDSSIKAIPLDQKTDSEEYQAFISRVLELNETELKSHWQDQISKFGKKSPKQFSSTRTILKLISKNKGGIGYIKKEHVHLLPDIVQIFFWF